MFIKTKGCHAITQPCCYQPAILPVSLGTLSWCQLNQLISQSLDMWLYIYTNMCACILCYKHLQSSLSEHIVWSIWNAGTKFRFRSSKLGTWNSYLDNMYPPWRYVQCFLVQCFTVFHMLSHILPYLILRTTLEVGTSGIVIIPISIEETETRRNLLAYLPQVIQLISGRRGFGSRLSTLAPIIIYLVFWNYVLHT